MATISPGKTWLPLNVTIDANDRGDSMSIELEDEQPQDNFRLKAKRGGDNGGLWEVLLIHFEFFPMIPLSQCIPSTRTTRGLGPNSGACAYMLVPAAAGRGG